MRSAFPVALFLCICSLWGASSTSAQSDRGKDTTLGRIILIDPKEPKGALQVQRGKSADPVNATEGMLVNRGHLLTLSPKARAKIICGDGQERNLAPGKQGCPCTMPCVPEVCGLRYDDSTLGSMRGPDTEAGLFPVIISPRKTKLQSLRPTIRWAPIIGAKERVTYNVTMYGDGMKSIWVREVVSETKLTYPADTPSLMPGQVYKVVVTANGLSSGQDHSPGLGFITLTEDRAKMLSDEEAKIIQLKLPEPQTRFLVSSLYAARGLYSEAIEQLENLFTTMEEPAVVILLGDLYATIGLNREAEKKYLKALDLTASNDLEGVGLIQKSLTRVYENLGEFDEAITELRKAINTYRQLGNRAVVRALLNKEREMKNTGRGK